jgi:TonB C terminal
VGRLGPDGWFEFPIRTLLLHALVIQSVPFGNRGPVRPPEAHESGTSPKSNTQSSEELVLITLPTVNLQPAATQNLIPTLPDLSKMKIKSAVEVEPPALAHVETLALSEETQASSASRDGSEDAEKARLFGIYTGQIQARIDRVWRRPRTPVNEDAESTVPTDSADSFQCEAQIVQDATGIVQEILLPRCNGSAAWQRSLVLAIQQASPLPAPPSAKVFSRSVTLDFIGIPYGSGAAEQDYEFEPRAVVGSN